MVGASGLKELLLVGAHGNKQVVVPSTIEYRRT